MEDLAENAIDTAIQQGASYADVRAIRHRREQVLTRDGALDRIGEEGNSGFGIRVLVNGAWGFAAHVGLDPIQVAPTAVAAVEAARAAAKVNTRPVELAPNPPAVDHCRTPLKQDPFSLSLTEKQDLAVELERNLRAAENVSLSRVELLSMYTDKLFYSSEGARIRQEITECGGSLFAMATGEGKPARRTFHNHGQAGWEFIEEMNLPARAQELGEQASELLTAPYVEPGVTDVVLGSEQLALMVHETCGHPTELDRVLGFEDAFAGGSFLLPEELNRLQYGSTHVNLSADSTLPGGLGTFGYDDDGVAAQRFPLVREGIFRGYLCSRDTAPLIGYERTTGCSRADGWGRMPIVRMVNVNLEPGEVPLDDLIGGIDSGLYLDSPASWSLDDKRLNFHFGLEYGREIKGGKLGRVVRGATLQDITPNFWGRCDGVADRDSWRLWGFLTCAKGEPLQLLHVGHGASPARFRGIRVGVER